MTDDTVVEWIQSKYENLAGELDERARRRWGAVEALSLGRGGIAAVAKATGISDRTIRDGIRELREGDAGVYKIWACGATEFIVVSVRAGESVDRSLGAWSRGFGQGVC